MESQCTQFIELQPGNNVVTTRTLYQPGLFRRIQMMRWTCLWLLMVAALSFGTAAAEETSQTAQALNTIFGEDLLATNTSKIRRSPGQRSQTERFELLSDWVLPNSARPTFRLTGSFTQTQSAPGHKMSLNAAQGFRRQTGGRLTAPALDLVDLAKKLNRLHELADRVDSNSNPTQNRSRLAMKCLIELARSDSKAALTTLGQLFEIISTARKTKLSDRWPEMLALSRAVLEPETRAVAGEMLYALFDLYVNDIHGWKTNGSAAFDAHLFGLLGMHQLLGDGDADIHQFAQAPDLKNWIPVSSTTAHTRGEGRPPAHWQHNGVRVDNLSGHDRDQLLFRMPLRGDYEVECDISAFSWREIHLMVAGTYVAPYWDEELYELGSFRTVRPKGLIDPPLNRSREWTRYRAVVRNGVCTTYFNGRKVHVEPVFQDSEPWLAIISRARYHGSVRNLRITGNPIIPEQINLAASSGLDGWISYEDPNAGVSSAGWQFSSDKHGTGIVARRQFELAGTHRESLLRYHRPMVEDGVIQYEFFYRPGEACTHPAIDRLAFLLSPDGIQTHWITDGKYDRTEGLPAGLHDEPEHRCGPDKLPLIPDDWNQLRFVLVGDEVRLVLNDRLVYKRMLEPTNQRTFGLFCYTDQTELRVRNIIWQGTWPRSLPSLSEQQLAETDIWLDDQSPERAARFRHDFRTGIPANVIRGSSVDWRDRISVTAGGVRATLPESDSSSQCSLGPRVRFGGDFDVQAEFDELQMHTTPGQTSTIYLMLTFANEARDSVVLYRRLKFVRGREDNSLVPVSILPEVDGARRSWLSVQTDESQSGVLRISRRGREVYCLFAEGDSVNFRAVAKITLTDADIAENGVQLVAKAGPLSSTKVVWKEVSVQAERLLGPNSDVLMRWARQLTGTLPPSGLEFDGRTSYVRIPSLTYDGSHAMTIEAFMTPDAFRSVAVGDTQYGGIGLGIPATRYNIHIHSDQGYRARASNEEAVRNLRVHLAGTFDGKTMNLFVDGKRQRSEKKLKGSFNPSPLMMTIGGSPSPTPAGVDWAFDGIMDGVRFSKSIRYTDDFEVPAMLTTDDDTLAVYDFEQKHDTILKDVSGNGHDGEIHDAAWVTDAAIRQRAATALTTFGAEAVPLLQEALTHEQSVVRLIATQALATMGRSATTALQSLKGLASDASAEVRSAAAEAVRQIEARREVP